MEQSGVRDMLGLGKVYGFSTKKLVNHSWWKLTAARCSLGFQSLKHYTPFPSMGGQFGRRSDFFSLVVTKALSFAHKCSGLDIFLVVDQEGSAHMTAAVESGTEPAAVKHVACIPDIFHIFKHAIEALCYGTHVLKYIIGPYLFHMGEAKFKSSCFPRTAPTAERSVTVKKLKKELTESGNSRIGTRDDLLIRWQRAAMAASICGPPGTAGAGGGSGDGDGNDGGDDDDEDDGALAADGRGLGDALAPAPRPDAVEDLRELLEEARAADEPNPALADGLAAVLADVREMDDEDGTLGPMVVEGEAALEAALAAGDGPEDHTPAAGGGDGSGAGCGTSGGDDDGVGGGGGSSGGSGSTSSPYINFGRLKFYCLMIYSLWAGDGGGELKTAVEKLLDAHHGGHAQEHVDAACAASGHFAMLWLFFTFQIETTVAPFVEWELGNASLLLAVLPLLALRMVAAGRRKIFDVIMNFAEHLQYWTAKRPDIITLLCKNSSVLVGVFIEYHNCAIGYVLLPRAPRPPSPRLRASRPPASCLAAA